MAIRRHISCFNFYVKGNILFSLLTRLGYHGFEKPFVLNYRINNAMTKVNI